MPMARLRKFCGILAIRNTEKWGEKYFSQRLFLIDIKVYKIRLKDLKKICTNSTGLCMGVEIAFSGFLLQNAFIRVKICFYCTQNRSPEYM